MQRKSSAPAGHDNSGSGYNNFRQHDPQATFIVTTPENRGKHNRVHISTINANSAFLRHARTRVTPVKVDGPTSKSGARKPRVVRSLTVDSGYISDLSATPEGDPHSDSSTDIPIIKSSLRSYAIQHDDTHVENFNHNNSDDSNRVPSPTTSQYNLDRLLQSTLDPFIQLSMDLSSNERGLLHFYLTDARTLVFGSSPRPQYDVAIYCARLMVGHCSLYTVVKLASAESILCRALGKDLSPAFYFLRGRAYNMMNTMLNDPEANFFDKIEGFNQLGIMEMFLNHSVEQKRHLQAMYHFIEENGGCTRFLSNERPRKGTLGIGVYSGNFVYVDLPIASKPDLDIAVSKFISSLERAVVWYRLRWSCLRHTQNLTSGQESPWKPLNLRMYLDWLIECLKQQDTSTYLTRGAFHSIFNLFMTLVVFDYDAGDSRVFLWQVDCCMQQRPAERQSSREMPDLVPVSHIFQGINTMLYYVRTLLSSERQEAEVELCQSSLDALKILPLLSRSSVLRMLRDMIRCLLMPVSDFTHNADIFDENYMQDLSWEAEATWKSNTATEKTKFTGS